jgi:hypothetical protein
VIDLLAKEGVRFTNADHFTKEALKTVLPNFCLILKLISDILAKKKRLNH